MENQEFLYMAGFVNNAVSPPRSGDLIRSNIPFYYRILRGNRGIDIVTFYGRDTVKDWKFYRYSTEELLTGIDLDADTPSLHGANAVKIIKKEYIDARK